MEPNNLTAIHSLNAYRTLRYGRNLDLIVTDQHSYRSANCFSDPALGNLGGEEFIGMFPEALMRVLDGGRAANGGHPPAEIRFDDAHVPNPRRSAPPQTILGAEQKAWFKEQLRSSTATWKIWGNSLGTLDQRADPQNLPPGLTKEPWPADGGYAAMSGGDYGTAYLERAEIYDLVRDAKITGFAIVSGDRHSFWAGYAAAELPPGKFEPVGLSFVGASLISPGAMEAQEHNLPKDPPLRPLFLADRPEGRRRGGGAAGLDLQHAAQARRPFVPRVREELRPRRALARSPTRISRRTWSSWISAVTATPRSSCRPARCAPSSSAFRARSRAAKDRTAVRSAIGSCTPPRCGRAASAPGSRHRFSRATPGCRSDGRTAPVP